MQKEDKPKKSIAQIIYTLSPNFSYKIDFRLQFPFAIIGT